MASLNAAFLRKVTDMIMRLRRSTTLFLGMAFIILQASVAYAHGGGGEFGTTDIMGMYLLSGA